MKLAWTDLPQSVESAFLSVQRVLQLRGSMRQGGSAFIRALKALLLLLALLLPLLHLGALLVCVYAREAAELRRG